MKKLMDVIVHYADSEGRVLSDPFMKLPSRREYPDYYEIIKKPIDIKKILAKIEGGGYVDVDEMERDFMQLCKNAQFYNEDASLIHEDSIVLQSVFTEARKRLEATTAEEKEEVENESKGEEEEEEESGSDEDAPAKMKLKITK
jgi:SWI/SNF-related matrix-associated actin-dependent regulator of chromatin subfamily A protein 2/4